jgi:hypothetical protein
MYENLCGNCVGRIELTFDNGIKKIKCTLMNIALHKAFLRKQNYTAYC